MKILIVEDDVNTANVLKMSLSADAHTVEVANDGIDGSFLARSYDYDAIVLDYTLPGKDGLAICDEIRKNGKTTPILFLSVTDDIDAKVQALSKGADDYMTKPFSLQELNARIKAVSRRPKNIRKSVINVADIVLDSEKQIVKRSGKVIRLTKKEFCLLEYLMNNVGVILSRPMLMEHVWTADSDPLSNTIEAHIAHLRKKINAGGKPNLIANVQGRGYIIDTVSNLKKYPISQY